MKLDPLTTAGAGGGGNQDWEKTIMPVVILLLPACLDATGHPTVLLGSCGAVQVLNHGQGEGEAALWWPSVLHLLYHGGAS